MRMNPAWAWPSCMGGRSVPFTVVTSSVMVLVLNYLLTAAFLTKS